MKRLFLQSHGVLSLTVFIITLLIIARTPVSAQAPLSQMDSTVTVSPEGDTVVTYQLRETDFGRNVIYQHAERKTLTEEEREKNYGESVP